MYKLSFLLVLVYIALLGRPVGKEYSLEPGWIADLNSGIELSVDDPDMIPFKFSDHFGYFTPGKGVLYNGKILYGTAVDRKGFINFSSINTNFILQDPKGMVYGSIEGTGYPFFAGDRRFMINSDGTALSEMDADGNIIWIHSFSSLITDLSVSLHSVLVGTLNSGIKILDKNGKEEFSYKPDFSRINTIYGTALSSNNSSILLITGLDPQRVVLFTKKNSGYRIVFSMDLKDEYRFQRKCGFSSDGAYAYYNNGEQLSIINTSSRETCDLPVGGDLDGIMMSGLNDLVYTSAKSSGGMNFSGFSTDGERMFYFVVPGDDSFLFKDSTGLYPGFGSYLLKLNLVRR